EALRAGVQRVDHHLAIRRSRDLDPAIQVILARRCHRPLGLTDLGGLRREVQVRETAALATRAALGEQLETTGVETIVELNHEFNGRRREDAFELLSRCSGELGPGRDRLHTYTIPAWGKRARDAVRTAFGSHRAHDPEAGSSCDETR